MSKAHRILGSFPLSIDAAPSNRDDASSSALSDDRSVTTATSCDPDSEAGDSFDDHAVGIAKSDSGRHHYPEYPSKEPLLVDYQVVGTTRPNSLFPSRNKRRLQQWQRDSRTSPTECLISTFTACARSTCRQEQEKKKPAKLDLSSLMSAPRLIRKVSHRQLGGGGEVALGLTCTKNAPIVLSP
ncbi:hypothetical protein G6O67_008873 [Ophiocordyceps sinensis]|uniref:Uncharacterized protein n=1 Tax=Ophiocordyceps sinensis TaxID=72228 RepID=A0A8H4LRS8_9HYPO|nr:hypothetical protein G6O67_008873 [Ophiocordyceps sinensis]